MNKFCKENLAVPWKNLDCGTRNVHLIPFCSLLQLEYEKMKGKLEEQLNSRMESKTKGIEKIMMENERLRKDIKKVHYSFDHFHTNSNLNIGGLHINLFNFPKYRRPRPQKS